MSMLNKNLNNALSEISSLMQTCDMKEIGTHCLWLVEHKMEEHTLNDCRIFSWLVYMKNEQLNDRLSLEPKLFAAINQI